MDKRIPQLNNPITLHFYSPEERLPADEELKIVICKTQKGFVSWNRAYYDGHWWHGSGSLSNVIAWASFSTEWVLGVDL